MAAEKKSRTKYRPQINADARGSESDPRASAFICGLIFVMLRAQLERDRDLWLSSLLAMLLQPRDQRSNPAIGLPHVARRPGAFRFSALKRGPQCRLDS